MIRLASTFTGFAYTKILKPVLFQFQPDGVHQRMVQAGSFFARNSVTSYLMKGIWSYQNTKIMKIIDGITFPNPVGLSAGFDYDAELLETLPLIGFGFHTVGTITLDPYEGNPGPHLTRFPNSQSILVNKGLKNMGAPEIIKKLTGKEMKIPVGISIASTNRKYSSELEQIKDITKCFQLFEESDVKHSYYELNISCPNTFGGEPFTTPAKLERLMKKMDVLELTKPLYVKMPIDQSEEETVALLEVLHGHNVQGVIFGNLTKDKTNPDIDPADREAWKKAKGNLSGKPTWKRSNRGIKIAKEKYGSRFTIIGSGGIFSGEDAAEKMKLGADLVQLITGMIYKGPQLIGQINQYLAERKVE